MFTIEKHGPSNFAKRSHATGKIVSRHPTRSKAVGSALSAGAPFASLKHTGDDVKKGVPVELAPPR